MSSRSIHIRNLSSPVSENPKRILTDTVKRGTKSADDLQAGWEGVTHS